MNLSTAPSSNKDAEMIRIFIPVIIVIILLVVGKNFISGLWKGITSPFTPSAGEEHTTSVIETVDSSSPFNPNYFEIKKKSLGNVHLLTQEAATKYATQIYDAIGYVYDSPEEIIAAIKQCSYKTQISFLAATFSNLYGKDLFTFLQQKLNKEVPAQWIALGKIIDYVNGLNVGRV